MARNVLLEFFLENVDPDALSSAVYSIKEPTGFDGRTNDLVTVDNLKRISRLGSINKNFGYTDYVELFISSYVKELVDNMGLQRKSHESGPNGYWGGNWRYLHCLEPQVKIDADFDMEKDWLRMNLSTNPEKGLRGMVLDETHSFMRKVGIRYEIS